MKKMPVALIAALLVQTVGGLVWAGGAAARIATLEQRVGEQRLVAERLARLEAQGEAVRAAVERIERQLEGSDGEALVLLPLWEKVARRAG
ncbi:hypothetical protein [Brevundimonas diminuta]|nr:hypothetical protein [Brevundimonas diminuta]